MIYVLTIVAWCLIVLGISYAHHQARTRDREARRRGRLIAWGGSIWRSR